MPDTRQDMVTIDNAVLDRLMTDQRVLAVMPSLRNPPTVPGRTAGCCGQPSPIDYAALKTQLATLPTSATNVIKEVLNTRQLRFFRQTKHHNKPAVVKVTR